MMKIFRPRALCILCALALILALSLVLVALTPATATAQEMGDLMEGMTAPQVSDFMEVANKVSCPCPSCGSLTLLQCRLSKPTCGHSKRVLNLASTLIKSGQSASQVITQLASAPSPAPAARPTAPSPPAGDIELAVGDSPTLGPEDAEVTILEFSDFQ